MQKTANLKKHIDFNLLGDDNEANHMDLDENDLSEEITDVSPPPLKYARVPVSRISLGRRHSFEVNALTNDSLRCRPKTFHCQIFPHPLQHQHAEFLNCFQRSLENHSLGSRQHPESL